MNVKELIFGAQAGAAQSLTPADKDLQGLSLIHIWIILLYSQEQK